MQGLGLVAASGPSPPCPSRPAGRESGAAVCSPSSADRRSRRDVNCRRAAGPALSRLAAAANGAAHGDGAISPQDYSLFVRFLHMASPYVAGHRGRTFVITIPGEVVARRDRLYPLLEDILLLHGLGVRLVVVCGAHAQITAYLKARGRPTQLVGAYRVTDEVAMQGAVEAAGAITTNVSAFLSRAPSIPVVRRHARSAGGQFHFAPAVQVVSGNYVTAKRRGIVNGVDFGQMGMVRFVQRSALEQQLAARNLVLLTNIGVSSSGELLNCNAFDVATHAAVELRADKLLIITGEDVRALNLPHYLPLDDAEEMIMASVCDGDQECIRSGLERLGHTDAARRSDGRAGGKEEATTSAVTAREAADGNQNGSGGGGSVGGMGQQQGIRERVAATASWDGVWQGGNGGVLQTGSANYGDGGDGGDGGGSGSGSDSDTSWQLSGSDGEAAQQQQQASQRYAGGDRPNRRSRQRGGTAELALDLDSWQSVGYPNAVLAAVVACKHGVKRAHLVDEQSDGALLLELYTRDGTPGVCMIAADLYEGIRPAEGRDVRGVQELLARLADDGLAPPFPLEDVPARLADVTVIEREGKVLGCAVVCDLGEAADGVRVAELGAFVVHPAYRRAGFGDSLLDYVEQEMRQKGFRRAAIIAGQGSYEWFAQRDFARVGAAATSALLPAWRQAELQAAAAAAPGAAAAQLLVKPIVELDASVAAQPGKRIGF